MDVVLGNHELYCTVCDNNNQNCTVHNTTALMGIEHQKRPFQPKPYAVDNSNPFYRYDPDQCILCGRCVEACQNLQVNETLTIRWEDPHPRVLWDGGETIAGSSCVACGHCVSVCPCNALMEKSMLGHAGYLTGLPKGARRHDQVVKGIEPETGYGPILEVSEAEAAMRQTREKRTKTVCTYCGVGCSFDVWTKDRQVLKSNLWKAQQTASLLASKGSSPGTTSTPKTGLPYRWFGATGRSGFAKPHGPKR